MTKRKWLALAAAAATLAGLTGAAAVVPASAQATNAGPVEQTSCPKPDVTLGSSTQPEGVLQWQIAQALPCAFTSTAWEPAGSKHFVIYLAPLNTHTRFVAQAVVDASTLVTEPGYSVELKAGRQSYSRATEQFSAMLNRFPHSLVEGEIDGLGIVHVHAKDAARTPDAALASASHVVGYQAEPIIDHEFVEGHATATYVPVSGNGTNGSAWSTSSAYTNPGTLVDAWDVGNCSYWETSGTSLCGSTIGSGDYIDPLVGSDKLLTGGTSSGCAVYNSDSSNCGQAGSTDPYLSGYRAEFQGNTGGVHTTNTGWNLSNAWTFSGWFSTERTGCSGVGICTIMSENEEPFNNYYNFINFGWIDGGGYCVYAYKNGSALYGGSPYCPDTTDSPENTNEPVQHQLAFVTVTYDGAQTMRIYVNGVLNKRETLSGSNTLPNITSGHLYFGTDSTGGGGNDFENITPDFEHLAFFSSALTDAQAKALFAAEVAGSYACTTNTVPTTVATPPDADYSNFQAAGVSAMPTCRNADPAGLEIETWNSASPSTRMERCTLGWAEDTGTLIKRQTDGHCAGDTGTGAGTNSVTVNTFRASSGDDSVFCWSCYNSQSATANLNGNYNADLLTVDINDWNSDGDKAKFFDGENVLRDVKGQASFPISNGTTIYKYGVTTGLSSSSTIASNTATFCVANFNSNPFVCLDNQFHVTGLKVGEGDSGGPVWLVGGDGKFYAVGTTEGYGTSDTDFYANREDKILAYTGNTLVTCGSC